MRIITLLTDGFEELEAIGTIALLKRSGIEVDIYSISNTKASGKHNLTFSDLILLKEPDLSLYDGLLLPGGPHYAALEENEKVKEIIKTFMDKEKLIASICAAPTILGHMGFLKDKKYTCFTSMDEDFGGTYIDTYVVKDDNLITARSAAASIDFAFEIITYLQGEQQAEIIKKQIYY